MTATDPREELARIQREFHVLVDDLFQMLARLSAPGLPPAAVTADEAAQLTGLSRPTINRMVRDGRLPRLDGVGRRLLIPRSAIDELCNVITPDSMDPVGSDDCSPHGMPRPLQVVR